MRALAFVALAACAGPKSAFDCDSNDSCRMGAVTGTCEGTGFCSFPDPGCPNGSRYGAAAGNGLANQCVGEQGSDGGLGGDGGGPPATLGSWEIGTAVDVPRYTHATAIDGDRFYVLGGISGTTSHADVWFANVNTSAIEPGLAITSWNQTTAMPIERRTFGAAIDSGFLYVFAGVEGLGSGGSMEAADVAAAKINADGTLGTWTATTPVPETLRCHAVAAANGNAYVVGGKSGGAPKSFVLRATLANGTVGTWKNEVALDETVFNEAAVAVGGYLYVIGGCTTGNNACTGTVLDTVEVAKINADGSLGPFTHTTSLPTGRWHHTAAASASKATLFVLGGKYGTHNSDPATTDVIAAHINNDGTLGAWTTVASLQTGRSRATAAVIGDLLVFVNTDTQIAPIQ
jgi:hypothetical protein